ncbi:MAG: hypothetical protein OEW24_04640 [Chloroflexota bacterium]|nr:hypothetical protein [Chloroflexota bacterium]
MADYRDSFASDPEPDPDPGSSPAPYRPAVPATETATTAGEQSSCQFCGGSLLTSVFDTTFREGGSDERLFFAIPGALCIPCRQLYVDRQLIGILGLGDSQCTFAIQSDRVLRAGAA